MYDWIYDDKTWCGNDCSYMACPRNIANKISQTRYVSMALFRDTETCPLNKVTGNKQKKGQKDMNKKELVEKLVEKTGDKKSEKVVNALIETIEETVAEGGCVQLVGFGSFEARKRASRECRNPMTGEMITVPSKRVPVFNAGRKFRELCK